MITSALPFTTRTLTPIPIFIINPHIPAIAKKVFLAVNSCDCAVCVLKTQIFWKRASSQSSFQAGTSPCLHARCRTCHYISSDTSVRGPQNTFVIKKALSCHRSGLVYCISCRRCPAVYIGETGRTLRQRFGEHLWSIEKNLPGFPVAEHFNTAGHSIDDALVQGMMLSVDNAQQKCLEMQLIFQLGTSQLRGLNSDFRFL